MKELRLLARGAVIIDQEDKIRYIEYVTKIAEEPDYDEALKVIKELL